MFPTPPHRTPLFCSAQNKNDNYETAEIKIFGHVAMSHNRRQREITVSPHKTVDGRTNFRQTRIASTVNAHNKHRTKCSFFPLFTHRVDEPPAAVAS